MARPRTPLLLLALAGAFLAAAFLAAARPAAATPVADPLLAGQWDLTQIAAPAAWASQTAPAPVLVGVVDTGVDWLHPDLRSAIWANPGESGGGRESNGRDDDGDGYVDDWHGWDFASSTNNP